MKPRHLLFVPANFLATLLLLALIGGPFYFAKNFTKVENAEGIEQAIAPSPSKDRNVAGARTQVPYVVTSQADKFPNMTVSQNGDITKISFTKIGPTQAFIGVFTLTNQKDREQTYNLEVTSGAAKLFFGQNLDNQISTLTVPPKGSAPVSLISGPQEASQASLTVEFRVGVK